MSYVSHSIMFRDLDDAEEQDFIAYAQANDPPNPDSWHAYHPVCRRRWIARGIDLCDAECSQCGADLCPHGEPLHFHHDGCPSCG